MFSSRAHLPLLFRTLALGIACAGAGCGTSARDEYLYVHGINVSPTPVSERDLAAVPIVPEYRAHTRKVAHLIDPDSATDAP